MNEPYLGELRAIAFNYAPKGWAFCNGQLLAIAQNQALFSLLGTTYGGDGIRTFALPNLQGRVPLGQAPGLAPYSMGQVGGVEAVTLTPGQIPVHAHPFTGSIQVGDEAVDKSPDANYPAPGKLSQYSNGPKDTTMGAATDIQGTTGRTGAGQAHDNRQPYLATYYAIALQGIFPPRN